MAFLLDLVILCVWVTLASGSPSVGPLKSRKDIIIDTDFLSFTDDVGAIAIANTLQRESELNILGIVADVQSRFSVPAMAAINAWYCHPNIAFAQSKPVTNETVEEGTPGGTFVTTLANYAIFPENIHDGSNPIIKNPVEFYHQTLSKAKAKSVTIVAIGFLTHLSEFYHSSGGKELIEEKVAELVVEAGNWDPNMLDQPSDAGFNMNQDLQASKVLERWPSPVTFVGEPLGNTVFTGEALLRTPHNNPVRVASELFKESETDLTNFSYDILAMYFAIFGLNEGTFAYANKGGQLKIFDNGTSIWNFDVKVPSTRAQHFLEFQVANTTIAKKIDDLLAYYGPKRPSCREQ